VTANSVLDAMKQPFQVDGHEVFITPSLGIAVFPNDGDDSDTLIQHAGVAMNQVKQRGRNGYEFYSAHMNASARERLSLENQLRRALERDELRLVYQPKVSLRTGRIVGAESLLRWNHPELGMVSPIRFIPLAEETGLIVAFGAWVLRTACEQNRAWQLAGLRNIRVAVNVSARQFRDGRFVRTVDEALQNSGLDPQYLTLELTENTIMENAKENLETLHQIKAMGVKLSVDDFGTGYSSLSYLKQLPLDELKIDRSFIMEIRSEADKAPIVTAIIGMAHSLGLTVVIEGIESEAQLSFSRAGGCDEYQGYLFSKPVATREFETMLAPDPT
jgi:EAL domain-containing protein (putative c-di-GMP-specific phosphodiesterase class I)